MNNIAKELEEIIGIYRTEFSEIDESIASIKISEDKWTLKEIIGHLIDSASNNHQRFIRFQLSETLEFPDYKNDEWLSIQNHQNMKYSELLLLFYYYNKLMVNIIQNIDKKCLENKWYVEWDANSTFITFERLVIHYVEHIKIHFTHFRERLSEIEKSIEKIL